LVPTLSTEVEVHRMMTSVKIYTASCKCGAKGSSTESQEDADAIRDSFCKCDDTDDED
jgi:hypothetical protein